MPHVLASAFAQSTAPAAAFFDRWVDHSSWHEWDPDTESVTVNGPVRAGATGRFKPRGGPAVPFTVLVCERPREYTDASRLLGARLTFQHLAAPTDAGTALEANVTLEGPLSWLWLRVMGKSFSTSVPAALERLVGLVESAR